MPSLTVWRYDTPMGADAGAAIGAAAIEQAKEPPTR
jgi:hypothetical protein